MRDGIEILLPKVKVSLRINTLYNNWCMVAGRLLYREIESVCEGIQRYANTGLHSLPVRSN